MGGNLADLFEAAASRVQGSDALVVDDRRWTYAELDERANRTARVLAAHGVVRDDRVGVLLGNTNEHVETLLACFKLRAVPVNLNTRLVAAELAELLALSRARVVVHEADLGHLLPPHVTGIAGGEGYEAALATVDAGPPDVGPRSGDDLYVLYTGGTTGRPKGVLWRHRDLRQAALAGEVELGARRMLVACPLFHGTGQWMALTALLSGAAVLTTRARSVDPARIWDLAHTERASHLVVVGDAYARPLVDALEAEPDRWNLDGLTVVLSGGAALSPDVSARLVAQVPGAIVVDGYGSTETGGHARRVTAAGAGATPTIRFRVGHDTTVLDDELRPIPPDDGTEGWLARRGPLPIGYDGDPEATAATFPVIDGVRWAVPGDRARWAPEGQVEILGRGSLIVNTGGEKVHAEEVEALLRTHPGVHDVVVVGTPDDRWGEVVTAVVAPVPGAAPTVDDLLRHCRGVVAPFKAPRRLVLVDEVRRTGAGKLDHRWARQVAAGGGKTASQPPVPTMAAMALPQGDEKQRMVRDMFDAIAPRYDLVNRIMTFRLDVRWRRRTVRDLALPPGSRVLDLAAGTGDLCRDLTAAGHAPIGIDLSFGMLAAARTTAPLVHADALRLPLADGTADGATCGFALRNFVDLGAFFAELGRVVRPGGRIALLEVAEPANPLLRMGHGVYFGKVVPRIGALLSDPDAYRYLPRSVAYLPAPEVVVQMLRDAGFADATRTTLTAGISQLLVGTRDA